MTCDVYLDEGWRPVGYDLYPALMRSCARLTYDQVLDALQGAPLGASGTLDGLKGCATGDGIDDAIMQRVESLSDFAQARIAYRQAAGGLDFEFPEARVILDGSGKPCGVDLRVKNQATSLVEEAMILANEVVAAHLHERDFPALYRVHEKPSPDSLAALLPVLSEFSWFDRISPERFVAGDAHAVQQVLSESQGRLEADLVQALVLRAMKRACYKPECEGHYGLASAAYAHFTSPIRRYPDLVVHRMLRRRSCVARSVSSRRLPRCLGSPSTPRIWSASPRRRRTQVAGSSNLPSTWPVSSVRASRRWCQVMLTACM